MDAWIKLLVQESKASRLIKKKKNDRVLQDRRERERGEGRESTLGPSDSVSH